MLPLASNALRKVRSIRLPGILKILDTFETDSYLYIVSERVESLQEYFKRRISLTQNERLLIVYLVARAIKFINVEASSVLGYINFSTVFVNAQSEYKLGGFEVLTNLKTDPDQPIYRLSSKLPGFNNLLSPEVSSNGVEILRGSHTIKFDSWRLAGFIFTLFNNDAYGITSEKLITATNIPSSLQPAYKKLLSSSVTVRPTVEQFLIKGEHTYFNTELINCYNELDEFGLKNDEEKLSFFQNFESIKDQTPPDLINNRILPELIKFFNHSPENTAFALRSILTFGEEVPVASQTTTIKPIILKAFTLPDRQIRVLLLASLPKFVEILTKSDVSDRIFQYFVTGFSDSNPAIREETIKSVLYIVPKLSDRQLNNELLRFLAKTQSDEKPEIRTNTTICIGKISSFLNKSSRPTVLATAFGKAMKDPFIHSRLAAIMAISNCIEYFTPEVISTKILSVIAPSLLDKSSKVRDEAQKAFDLFFSKIKEEAAKLPPDQDTAADEVAMKEVTSDVRNFGISFSGALNKFASGFGGSLNQDANNGISPADSRASTPTVVASFKKDPVVKNEPQDVSYSDSWGVDEDEIEIEDDAWGFDDVPKEPIKPKVVKPVVKQMHSSTNIKPKASTTKTSSGAAAPKKGLQLKPKSKLKLELDVDQDDGWGDGW